MPVKFVKKAINAGISDVAKIPPPKKRPVSKGKKKPTPVGPLEAAQRDLPLPVGGSTPKPHREEPEPAPQASAGPPVGFGDFELHETVDMLALPEKGSAFLVHRKTPTWYRVKKHDAETGGLVLVSPSKHEFETNVAKANPLKYVLAITDKKTDELPNSVWKEAFKLYGPGDEV